LLLALGPAAVGGCKAKKDKPEEVPPPPSRGGASADLLATEIGNGLGLRASLAPTSTQWERAYVVDDKTVVLLGRALDETVALRSSDRGRTWTSLRAAASDWSSGGVGADGAVCLLGGKRKKAPVGTLGAIESSQLWLGAVDAAELRGPRAFFPDDDKLTGVEVTGGIAAPAVLSSELASLVVDRGGAPWLAFGVVGGATPAPLPLPKERFVPVPYGRPPQLVSVTSSAITVRAWPEPGDTLGPASPVPGCAASGNTLAALRAGPGCEMGSWSIQRVDGGSQPFAVAIEGTRALCFALPKSEPGRIGCGANAVVVETTTLDPTDPDKKRQAPQLVRCGFDGRCATPKSLPFAVWGEPHERRILTLATDRGVVAAMHAKAGPRWGLYLAQSLDGGATFELPRTVGEGQTDRGFFEIGALVGLPGRLLMLLSADVTGTARRGWYVLASDDGGSNWTPP
jgi:hypothetical protein